MERCRILFVITKSDFGGAQQYVYDLAVNLDKARYEVTVASGGDGILLQRLRESGITVVSLASLVWRLDPMHDLLALLALYRLIRNRRYHIVHTNSAKGGILGRLAAFLARTPVVIFTVHGFYFHRYTPRLLFASCWLIEKMFGRFTHALIAVSSADARCIKRLNLVPPTRAVTILNGITPRPCAVPGADSRRAFGLPPSARLVGTVTRVAPLKGVDDLVRSVPRILQVIPNAYLVIIGDGPSRDGIAQLAERLGISERVRLLGYRHDVADLLADIDVLVFPSLKEGLPLTVLEAMGAGKPIVVTDIDGHRELIEHEISGLLVPPSDPMAIADAVVSLLSNQAIARSMGMVARQRALDSYATSRMVGETDSLYQRLLIDRKSRQRAHV